MGLLDVPLRAPLVHFWVQVLQAQNLSTMHEQSLVDIVECAACLALEHEIGVGKTEAGY